MIKPQIATSLFFISCAALGQTAEPAFEVASVKPNLSNTGGVSINRPDSGRLTTENTSLRMLIRFAYDIRDTQLTGGPAWLDNDRWDIVAKTDREVPRTKEGQKILGKMLQQLLAERFQLVMHKESKEMPVYALVVGKNGPKLTPSTSDSKGMMRMGMGSLTVTRLAVADLARALSDQVGRTVVDETGIDGLFDYKLEFAPESGGSLSRMIPPGAGHGETAQDSDRPSLFAALQEQLGLKLEPRKAPVDIFVIDKAEKAAEN